MESAIWDDSALIRAFDAAMAKYKVGVRSSLPFADHWLGFSFSIRYFFFSSRVRLSCADCRLLCSFIPFGALELFGPVNFSIVFEHTHVHFFAGLMMKLGNPEMVVALRCHWLRVNVYS